MRTAGLSSVRVSVAATRCQYHGGKCPVGGGGEYPRSHVWGVEYPPPFSSSPPYPSPSCGQKDASETRMHSSRMHNVHCISHLGGGGVCTGCLSGGMSACQGGVCPVGCLSAYRGCLPAGGVCPVTCLPISPCVHLLLLCMELLTHACENITFPQLCLRTVNITFPLLPLREVIIYIIIQEFHTMNLHLLSESYTAPRALIIMHGNP